MESNGRDAMRSRVLNKATNPIWDVPREAVRLLRWQRGTRRHDGQLTENISPLHNATISNLNADVRSTGTTFCWFIVYSEADRWRNRQKWIQLGQTRAKPLLARLRILLKHFPPLIRVVASSRKCHEATQIPPLRTGKNRNWKLSFTGR